MSSDTYTGKDDDWKVDKDYLQAVMDKVNFPKELLYAELAKRPHRIRAKDRRKIK